jgi:DNA-binding transcriptional LysR family regulator
MKNLGSSEQLLVAHPAFLDEHGRPEEPRQAAALPTMDLTRVMPRHAWELTGEDGDMVTIPFQPRYVSDDMAALRDAAINRIGIVQLPEYMVRSYISAGELEVVLPKWKPKAGMAPAVRHFIDFIEKEFALVSRGAPVGIAF